MISDFVRLFLFFLQVIIHDGDWQQVHAPEEKAINQLALHVDHVISTSNERPVDILIEFADQFANLYGVYGDDADCIQAEIILLYYDELSPNWKAFYIVNCAPYTEESSPDASVPDFTDVDESNIPVEHAAFIPVIVIPETQNSLSFSHYSEDNVPVYVLGQG